MEYVQLDTRIRSAGHSNTFSWTLEYVEIYEHRHHQMALTAPSLCINNRPSKRPSPSVQRLVSLEARGWRWKGRGALQYLFIWTRLPSLPYLGSCYQSQPTLSRHLAGLELWISTYFVVQAQHAGIELPRWGVEPNTRCTAISMYCNLNIFACPAPHSNG